MERQLRNYANDGDNTVPISSPNCTRNGSDCAIHLRDVHKSYSNDALILQGFSMNVKKGTIYGLLGASGCGKTTVLSSIVGLTNWNSGNILVFGREPGSTRNTSEAGKLGYMPQDLALNNQLSIKEVMELYGNIYNMGRSKIAQRRSFLSKLLDLPPHNVRVGDLSGGQQRRVSLSLALIHSPQLLVLDEPTVGLDPLLRQTIWAYFQEIVNDLGVTILLSTHYNEEARLSTTIGIMRSGRLIAEDQPLSILRYSNNESLEKAILQLCHQDEENPPNIGPAFNNVVDFESEMVSNLDFEQNETRKPKRGNKFLPACVNMSQRVLGLSIVILISLIRNKLLLVALLSLSIIQGCLYLTVFGVLPKGLVVGIVNHNLLNSSLGCDSMNHSQSSCDTALESYRYLRILEQSGYTTLVHFHSEEDALLEVRLGRSCGYLSFPENFARHTFDFLTQRRFAQNESIRGSRVHAYLDKSAYVTAFLLTNHLLASYSEYLKQWAVSCNVEVKQVELPFHFRPPVYSTYSDVGILNFLIPGFIIYSTMLAVSVVAGLILISERNQGIFRRLRVAGMSTADIVVSYLVSHGIIVTLTLIIINTLVLHVGFGFVINGSFWLYILMFLLSGICGTAIGLLLGIICKDEVEGLIVLIFISIISLVAGGAIFPLENMTILCRYIAYILPVTLPILAMRSIIVRGVGLMNPTVWPGVLVLIFWTVGLLLIVVIVTRKS